MKNREIVPSDGLVTGNHYLLVDQSGTHFILRHRGYPSDKRCTMGYDSIYYFGRVHKRSKDTTKLLLNRFTIYRANQEEINKLLGRVPTNTINYINF